MKLADCKKCIYYNAEQMTCLSMTIFDPVNGLIDVAPHTLPDLKGTFCKGKLFKSIAMLRLEEAHLMAKLGNLKPV